MAVNLTGAFNVVRAVLPGMLSWGWGRLMLVSCDAARGGLGRQGAHAASKAGVVALAKTLALGKRTARHHGQRDPAGTRRQRGGSGHAPEILDAAVRRITGRRLRTMEEGGWLACFLAGDQAAYINGAELVVDGGLSLNTVVLGSRREALEAEGR